MLQRPDDSMRQFFVGEVPKRLQLRYPESVLPAKSGRVGSNPTLSASPFNPMALGSRFHYVYVLKSLRDGRLYVGSTHDLKSRLKPHHSGLVTSTKPRRPLELIFYEAYLNEYDAKRRESYFKTSKGRTSLKAMLAEFLKAAEGPPGWLG